MPVDNMFGAFPIMFLIMFFLVFGIIIFVILKGILQWNKNNNSPRLSTEATIVTKREDVSHHHSSNNDMMDSTSTTYYVTFQVPSGDRMELHVSGSEFGMLAEGDVGTLTFQGTRYISFIRR